MPSAASRIGYLVANALRQQAGYDRLSHSEWDEMHRANRDGCTVPSEVRTGIAIGEEAVAICRPPADPLSPLARFPGAIGGLAGVLATDA